MNFFVELKTTLFTHWRTPGIEVQESSILENNSAAIFKHKTDFHNFLFFFFGGGWLGLFSYTTLNNVKSQ